MYYAIHDGDNYIDVAYNATFKWDVRVKLFEQLKADGQGLEILETKASWPLEDIITAQGWRLEKSETPFPNKKFRVVAAVTTYCYLDVDAQDVEEARSIAEEADGEDFYTMDADDTSWPGSFTIEDVKPIS